MPADVNDDIDTPFVWGKGLCNLAPVWVCLVVYYVVRTEGGQSFGLEI